MEAAVGRSSDRGRTKEQPDFERQDDDRHEGIDSGIAAIDLRPVGEAVQREGYVVAVTLYVRRGLMRTEPIRRAECGVGQAWHAELMIRRHLRNEQIDG